uniref:Solute carrier family 12 member 6 n=1 Tax=Acrobeloides nanus TaxID=290746 RepID=A0A914BUW3_9BILA
MVEQGYDSGQESRRSSQKSRKSNKTSIVKGLLGKKFMKKKVNEYDENTNPQIPDVTITNENPDQNKNGGSGLFSWGSFKQKSSLNGHNLALYEEPEVDGDGNFITSYIKGYTTPGPKEREESKKAKANLGVMLGVYLPTIQHILGVTMFIRLAWCVGVAGVGQTFLMLALCCICTFLTCISVSAVATNGVIEGGGAYFMISRNLGPEFGSAVGILFYLANTIATSMYLVGGVEILLLYIFPGLTIGGEEVHTDTHFWGMMSNNLRLYGTILLLIEFVIVAMGVRFVQMLAPVSLVCVVLSILACYAGGIEKTLYPNSAQNVCMLGDHLLQARLVLPPGADISEICDYCTHVNTSFSLIDRICPNNTCTTDFLSTNLRCVSGYPGFASDSLIQNLPASYPKFGEYDTDKTANKNTEVFQDVTTTFFLLLAIYFPAVTGILTGTNMSGDLANPQKSIPTGTIAAQLTTSFVYFSLALCFGASIAPPLLKDKYGQSLNGGMVVAYLAWPSPWVLLIGSFLSTFGAALQCLCSAPRLLQAIGKDNVIPILAPFAKVTKKNEPFYGLILTTIIAELAILMGAMDTIAAVVDFFFLMCYAFINLICALHSLLGAPNWRPRYTYYHWTLSLLGAGLCFFIMFSTHWDYSLIVLILCFAIYKYVEYKGAKKEWGDGIRGLALSTAQYSLMKIDERDPHPKNWRPQILVLHSMPWSRELVDIRYLNLINMASQLKAGRGLTMVVSFIRGDPNSTEDRKKSEEIKRRMQFDMEQTRLRGFAKALIYGEDQITGSLHTLIQSIGIGGLRPNCMLISWPTKDYGSESIDSEYQTFTDKLLAASANGMSLLVAKGITEFPSRVKLTGTIDVYWIVQDGGLCILMAFLLKQNKVWRNCKLRVIAIALPEDNNTKLQQNLQDYVYQLRIDAKIKVVELSDPQISKTAFERTLLMEERRTIQRQMAQGKKAQTILNNYQRSTNPATLSPDEENKKSTDDNSTSGTPEVERKGPLVTPVMDFSEDHQLSPVSTPLDNMTEEEKEAKLKALDRKKVHKMHTAIRLNEIILENSSDSQLVLLNLPKPPRNKEGVDDYFHYLEVLSDNVKRVLFVRGTGAEVITTSS